MNWFCACWTYYSTLSGASNITYIYTQPQSVGHNGISNKWPTASHKVSLSSFPSLYCPLSIKATLRVSTHSWANFSLDHETPPSSPSSALSQAPGCFSDQCRRGARRHYLPPGKSERICVGGMTRRILEGGLRDLEGRRFRVLDNM